MEKKPTRQVKPTPVKYKREKDKLEISGDFQDVKGIIRWEQWLYALKWFVPVILLLLVFPAASLLPLLLKWFKQQLPFMLLIIIQLSG